MSKITILKLFVWSLAILSGAYIGRKIGSDVSLAIMILIGSLNFILWYQERDL